MKNILATGVVILACAIGLPAEQATPSASRFSLDDASRVKRVIDPQFSPDGASIAYALSTPNLDENRHVSSLYRVDVASGKSDLIVAGEQFVGLSFQRWSPDGQQLAFLAMASANGQRRAQIFAVSARGGTPKQVTTASADVQQFAWSPDGRTFAFAAADVPEPKPGFQRWNDSFEVQPNFHLFMTAPVPPTHVWMIPSAGGESKRLTSGEWTLPVARPPGPPSSTIAWTPDGTAVVFLRSGGSVVPGLQAVAISDGALKPMGGGGSYPLYSPAGDTLAYIANRNAVVAPVGGGQAKNLTQAIDRPIFRAIWMPDGKSLIVGGNDTERVSMWQQPLDGPARKIDTGGVSANSSYYVDMAVSRTGALAFTGTTPSRPGELYYMASPTAPAKPLTNVNAAIAEMPLGKTEMVTYKFEKFDENGVLTYPVNFDPAKKYPLVLVIHGGPAAASLLTFDARAQIMAAKGWLVFSPNYRGSDNLGGDFQGAIREHAGAGPGRDVMAGLEAVKKKGIVDESRIGVSGWSYGGYMTTWLIGNYPSVWRAAVSGAAVTDRLDQQSFNDGNHNGAAFLSEEALQRERDQSPLSYVGKVKAPTLILANTGDYRVPITQSYKFFHALRANKVPTSFVAYPINAHNASDPVRQRDVSERWIAWFDKYFSDPPAAVGR